MLVLIRKLIRLPIRVKVLTVLVLFLSLYTTILFRYFSKQATFGKITRDMADHDFVNRSIIADIAAAIRIVSMYAWWPNLCRHQAYQAKLVCQFYRIPYTIYVGFNRDDSSGQIQGHAWTIVSGRMITGRCNPADYLIHSVFVG
ncbi:lasso peptide biosynthesis B2 protein [Fibrella sp. WM1]|uniref:lasso peptide biosynthesis B2 protein n=1 Tax=Fibrella musci TaxID=3242485 RepID=UPI003521AEB3